jgi:hypothetical protein
MTTQNYLIVEANIVTNNVVWDGDVNTWTPPLDSIQLIQTTTPAMVWIDIAPVTNPPTPPNYVLQEIMGAGDIGFTWNGTVLTTNQPQP